VFGDEDPFWDRDPWPQDPWPAIVAAGLALAAVLMIWALG